MKNLFEQKGLKKLSNNYFLSQLYNETHDSY